MATDPDTIIADPNSQTPPPDGMVSDSGLPGNQQPIDDGGTPPQDPPENEPPADDWRARMSGGDEKLLKYLARVPSEKAAIERLKRYEDDIKAGKYRKPLVENATDEEIAAWRKDNGIPDAPEGYLEALPDGLVVGDDDKPYVDQFLSAMHGKNADPAIASAALETYYSIAEEQAAQEADMIRDAERSAVEELRSEWGADYRRNLNAMTNYLQTLPEAVQEAFTHGRGPDGKPLGYNPEILRWLTSQALESNPLATVVPGAGANQASAIADEIAKIEKVMRTDRAAYNKDEKMQARLRELYDARSKVKA